MKILIPMYGYFPGQRYGGPPVSIKNLVNLLGDIDFYIVTRNHDLGKIDPYDDIKEGWNKLENNLSVMYLSDDDFNYSSFVKIVEETTPDIIYLQDLFQKHEIPMMLIAAKRDIPLMIAPRGELCKGAIDIKRFKKIIYLSLLRKCSFFRRAKFQSTSGEETEAIKRILQVKEENIEFLDNVPSFVFKNQMNEARIFHKPVKFVFVSRITSKKNLLFALNAFGKFDAECIFDIYGPIEDEDYWEECKNVIDELPKSVEVNYCGVVENSKVPEIFNEHDAFVFPTLSENYGHVIVESMMAGCLPLLSKGTTPWDDISDNGGFTYSIDATDQLSDTLLELTRMPAEEYLKRSNTIIDYLHSKVDVENLCDQYENAFVRMMK